MAKTISVVDDDMRPEYDFTGGVPGKHYKVLREEGYIVRIYNDDGTVTDRRVAGEMADWELASRGENVFEIDPLK